MLRSIDIEDFCVAQGEVLLTDYFRSTFKPRSIESVEHDDRVDNVEDLKLQLNI
jgi:hypothetical protein